jgi:hypothetical protein
LLFFSTLSIFLCSCGKFLNSEEQVEAPDKVEIEAEKEVSELPSIIDFTEIEGGTSE